MTIETVTHLRLPDGAQEDTPARIRIALPLACGFVMAALVANGCTVVATTGPVPVPAPREAIHIPPGHLPPPGKCRIWFPGRPPGHQPPPGECHELQYRVPPGATLIYGR